MLLDTATSQGTPQPIFASADEFSLLNDFQRDFPLISRPFARIAEQLGCDEAAVLTRLARLCEAGTVGRVGPVFSPRRVGASTLAALKAPPDRIEQIARVVSAHREINHNYARDHSWNLWFVVTAPDNVILARVLRRIRRDTGCPVIALPLRVEYHIDLGFDLNGNRRAASPARVAPRRAEVLAPNETALMAQLQHGLPLVPRPFASVAGTLGVSEAEVIDTVGDWLARGIVKRFGVVVRHHELGYRANAMCVWDVPDTDVDALGERLAAEREVNLCYRRERAAAGWPYNLYCMIHGRDRASVRASLARIEHDCGLQAYPADVLFSTRRFKQTGARYVADGVNHG